MLEITILTFNQLSLRFLLNCSHSPWQTDRQTNNHGIASTLPWHNYSNSKCKVIFLAEQIKYKMLCFFIVEISGPWLRVTQRSLQPYLTPHLWHLFRQVSNFSPAQKWQLEDLAAKEGRVCWGIPMNKYQVYRQYWWIMGPAWFIYGLCELMRVLWYNMLPSVRSEVSVGTCHLNDHTASAANKCKGFGNYLGHLKLKVSNPHIMYCSPDGRVTFQRL